MLKSLKQFREQGLGDITTSSDVSGHGNDIINDIAELLRKNADKLRPAWTVLLHSGKLDHETENDVKRLMGLIGNLKDSPREKKNKLRDPMSNVVTRPFSGPDGSGGGEGGGGGGEG